MKQLLIVILFGLTCCSAGKEQSPNVEDTETNSATDKEFMTFLSLLPNVNLPFETTCEKCCDHSKIAIDIELMDKYSSKGSTIIGLVKKMEDKVIILVTYAADNFMPTIEVRDYKGKLLGQMSFLTNYCGGEPGYYGRQYFRINPDISLTSIDTSYHMTYDSIDYNTIDTTKIEILRKDFLVTKKGR